MKKKTKEKTKEERLLVGPGTGGAGSSAHQYGALDDADEFERADVASPSTDVCGSLVGTEEEDADPLARDTAQSSFQERVIGMGMAWRRVMSPEPMRKVDAV